MSVVLSCPKMGNKLSYQHLQGELLLRLNKLSTQLNLSNGEYRVMGVLIGLWNKKLGVAFPSITYLTEATCLSRSTIMRHLKSLKIKGLIMVLKTSGKTNKYVFGRILTNEIIRPNNDTSTSSKNGTFYINNKESRTNNKIKTKYLDSLFKARYWKHKKTGKIYQVKPEIGTHILFRYSKETQKVTLTEYNNFSDSINNFEPVFEKNKKFTQKENKKPEKLDLIKNLERQGFNKEAQSLKSIFKC